MISLNRSIRKRTTDKRTNKITDTPKCVCVCVWILPMISIDWIAISGEYARRNSRHYVFFVHAYANTHIILRTELCVWLSPIKYIMHESKDTITLAANSQSKFKCNLIRIRRILINHNASKSKFNSNLRVICFPSHCHCQTHTIREWWMNR